MNLVKSVKLMAAKIEEIKIDIACMKTKHIL